MPEGDTVFATAHRLRSALAGEFVTHGELRHPRLARADLRGAGIIDVGAVGKHLFVRFDHGQSLHSHLRLDGAWHLYNPGQRWRVAGHQVRVVLDVQSWSAIGVRLHDLDLVATNEEHRLVGHLGPDLLSAAWGQVDEAEAVRRMRVQPHRTLGATLLDQRVMAGVGNVFMTEVCFLLKVAPFVPVGELDDATLTRAVVLARTQLYRHRGGQERNTTGERHPGRRLWVYRRSGKPCLHCGERIRPHTLDPSTLGARPTWFCPTCQAAPARNG